MKIYPALLRAYWQRSLMYRAVYAIWLVNAAFPLVMMAIWANLAQESPIQGFGSTDFIGYYLAAILVRRITGVGIVRELENLIRTGELSVYLIRPLDVAHHFVARVLTARLLGLPLIAALVGLAVLLTPGAQFNLHPMNLALFALACLTGFVFEFSAQYAIGGLSFWITQAHGVAAMLYLTTMLLGGYLVPLALFPVALQTILRAMPFQTVVALPAELLTGRLMPSEAIERLLICWVWVIAVLIGARLLWRAGMRSYSAVGA